MGNELTINKDNFVALQSNTDLGELIKPLIKEIHLFDTFIAGTTHLDDKNVIDEVKIDDKLDLKREDNKFDEKAVLVLNKKGQKLGYIPEKDNIIFSRLLDAGKMLSATVSDIEYKGNFTKISIGIYLVDF